VPVVVVDSNLATDDPRLVGIQVVRGDCRRLEVLEQARLKDASGVLILTSDDLVNITAALVARRVNPEARIVVRMFNQNLIPRFGAAVKNVVALSVSGLIAPLLAMTAATGDAIGAFKLDCGTQQISELVIPGDPELVGRTLTELAQTYRIVPLAITPVEGATRMLHDLPSQTRLSVGDRLVVTGSPRDLQPLLARIRGDLLPDVRWAGAVRRWIRTARRTLLEVDLAVKIATPIVFATVLASTLMFRFALGKEWADGLYQTVTIIATGSELHGENQPAWAKVFLSVLKLAGAAIIAAFTAIFTNYLIRARLGGALEVRRVPDGGHVVVCGLGNVGYRCVEELVALGERVAAIDRVNDNPFIATCRRKGVPTFVGDATIPEVLRQTRVESAKSVIAATDSELANLEIALLVRELNPTQRVVVRLTEPEFAEAVRDAADIRYAVSIPALSAPAFAAALFGDRVHTLIRTAGHILVVVELVIQQNDPFLAGNAIASASNEYRFLPLAVNGKVIESTTAISIKPGDRLTVVTELQDLERLIRHDSVAVA